jgi:nicotinate-nucleotide adenylyltransferase
VRTGVFGGTFDPPHIGHVIAAQDAADTLGLDRVLFVPAADPPHKSERSITPAEIRLEMLQAALPPDPRFEICTLELERPGPSYTVDTLRALHSQQEQQLHLLLGADQARDLPQWREPEEIARLACIVVLSRAGVETARLPTNFPVREIRVTRIDVSATDVRERVARNRTIHALVPAPVEAIIRARRLYVRPSNGDAALGVEG